MKKIIYSVLDLLTLKKGINRQISGFSLRIPTRYFKYFPPDYELSNINFLNENLTEGMTAIDVGAHIGLLTTIISKKVGSSGKVFSFEPTPSTYDVLKETVRINNIGNIATPIQKAVSDKAGKTSFFVTDIEAHNSNSLVDNRRDYGNEHRIDIDLVSIDETIKLNDLAKVDFIKIDAEGAELSVLKGAANTIEKHHPKMILALHPNSVTNFGDSLSDIWDFVIGYRYEVVYKNKRISKDFFVTQTGLFDVFLL